MIYLFGNSKGGVGKTTFACFLSAMLKRDGIEVLLVDADPQASSATWATTRSELDVPTVPFVMMRGKGLNKQMDELATKYQDIVIDAGGADSLSFRSALVAADICFVPFSPYRVDLYTATELEEVIEQAMSLNGDLKTYSFLNGAPTNKRMPEVKEAKAFLEEFEHINHSDIVISQRAAFFRAMGEGLLPQELAKVDRKAIAELESLYNFVRNHGQD